MGAVAGWAIPSLRVRVFAEPPSCHTPVNNFCDSQRQMFEFRTMSINSKNLQERLNRQEPQLFRINLFSRKRFQLAGLAIGFLPSFFGGFLYLDDIARSVIARPSNHKPQITNPKQ